MPEAFLNAIGRTTLLPLSRIVPPGHARILLKLEGENPTGSMKDRMALAMIEAAEKDGRLSPAGRVVEYTGGSTGVSLAFVCAVKGHPLSIVTSDAFSLEKRRHMQWLGAELTLVPNRDGGNSARLTRELVETARRLADEPGTYWTDQLNNPDQIQGYVPLGNEIWSQSDGRADAFVQTIGTSGSIQGVAQALRSHHPGVLIVGVEPAESAVLAGHPSGVHQIEGTGAGFVVPLWKEGIADELMQVSSDEAMAMARRLAKEEGVFAGTSTGSNVIAALRIAERLGPKKTVVTLMCDSGLKYFSTPLYAEPEGPATTT